MPKYRTYGALDDVVSEERDRGFTGFNNRLRPDQLTPGILFDSQNGRMAQNGEWQTRKGIDNIKAPLSTGTSALTLPFYLMDADITTSSVSVSSGELILDFSSAHGLGTSGSGQVQLDTSSLTVNPATPSGLYTITVVDADTIKLTDKTYVSASGSVTVTKPSLADGEVNEIYGSCIFSDPNDESESYIILAANTKAVAIKVSDPSTSYDLAYPSGETISSSVDMIQAFNKLIIFRKGDTPFEKDLSATNINTSPTLDKVDSGEYTQPTQIVCASGEFALIENRGIVHQTDGVSQGDVISVVGDKTLSGDDSSGLIIGKRFTIAKIFAAGSATGNLCVGGWVIRGDIRFGMSASQGALPSIIWGEDTIKYMAEGNNAQKAIDKAIKNDLEKDKRQISTIDVNGNTGVFSGSKNLPEIHHIQKEII